MGSPWNDDDEAPDRGTARRRGERDFEEGRGSYENPYHEHAREAFDDYEWRQASRAWEDGYSNARYLAEERQEEERRRRQEEARLAADARRRDEEVRLAEAAALEEAGEPEG